MITLEDITNAFPTDGSISVIQADSGSALGTNEVREPKFTLILWNTYKVPKPPSMWSLTHRRRKEGSLKSVTLHLTCKLSFSPELPKTKEEIEQILDKRRLSLIAWLERLKRNSVPTKA